MSRSFCGARFALLALIVLMISGCSGLREKPLNTEFSQRNWEIRRSTLIAVQSFGLQGRLAESSLAGARGGFAWAQSGSRFDLHVSGPLGVGALAISGDPRSVEIRTKDGVFVTDSPESFMQQKLGWSLPLAQLRYWVLGLPAPIRDEVPLKLILDDAGRAQTMTQSGWQLDYEEYQTVGTLSLPRKLSLTKAERSLRIVIDDWSGTP